MGLPFTGSPSGVLWVTTDKLATRALLAAEGLPVAPGGRLDPDRPDLLDRVPGPWILKPACEDASLGMEGDPVCATREAALARARDLDERFPGQAVVAETYPPRPRAQRLPARWRGRGAARRRDRLRGVPRGHVPRRGLRGEVAGGLLRLHPHRAAVSRRPRRRRPPGPRPRDRPRRLEDLRICAATPGSISGWTRPAAPHPGGQRQPLPRRRRRVHGRRGEGGPHAGRRGRQDPGGRDGRAGRPTSPSAAASNSAGPRAASRP